MQRARAPCACAPTRSSSPRRASSRWASIPRGDRLAIVTNGRGPGAARGRQRGRPRRAARASSTPDDGDARSTRCCRRRARAAIRSTCAATRRRSGSPPPSRRRSPTRTSTRCSRCTCRGPSIGATDAARAVAGGRARRRASRCSARGWARSTAARRARRSRPAASPNFYTPENAVEAFSFLAAYRRNQEWLLEVPPPQPEPEPPDLAAAERVRDGARRTPAARVLTESQAQRLLAAFGLPAPPATPSRRRSRRRARRRAACGYPGRAQARRSTRAHRAHGRARRDATCATRARAGRARTATCWTTARSATGARLARRRRRAARMVPVPRRARGRDRRRTPTRCSGR